MSALKVLSASLVPDYGGDARAQTPPGLRILHVVDSLEVGGLERVVANLAMSQRERGDTVSVFSLNDTKGFASELREARIPVVIGAKRRGWDLAVLRKLRQSACGAVDVIHTHNFVPNYYAAAALFGATRRPVQVSTCHDMGSRLNNRKLRWFYRWSLTRTARVAMVGRQVHDRYVQSGLVGRSRAATVLNGIPAERFATSPERRRAARAALSLPNDAVVIGCVGRFVGLKNHALMIDSLPALLATTPQLRLVLIGGGELEAALREQVRSLGLTETVVFAGQRADVAGLLPALDIFAMPSLTEGLSIALLEACATGLAVVATRVGGNPEIVHHEQTGLLVPAADGPALREALDTLVRDSSRRERLGANAAAWVREHASMDALSNSYDRFYRDALNLCGDVRPTPPR
jgi:glycosyltransferase involved in cell wall biosynthesis